jgi:hypothetical protein
LTVATSLSPRIYQPAVRDVGTCTASSFLAIHVCLLLSATQLLFASACTPAKAPQIPDDVLAEAMATGADAPALMAGEYGELQVFTTDLKTDGRVMKLRGLVRNPYPEPADGIRLLFQIFPAEGGRQLDQFQRVMDVQIAPAERTALRWDMDSMYAAGRFRFVLQAFAVKLGEKQIPPPPDWRVR